MTSRGLTLAWAFFRQNKVKLFPVMGCWTKNQSWANCDFLGACIPSLKTQGQSAWWREKALTMKVFKQGRTPGEIVPIGHSRSGFWLVPDWLILIWLILPNQRTASLGVILCFHACKLHEVSCLPYFVQRGFAQDKKIIDIRTKCKTDWLCELTRQTWWLTEL